MCGHAQNVHGLHLCQSVSTSKAALISRRAGSHVGAVPLLQASDCVYKQEEGQCSVLRHGTQSQATVALGCIAATAAHFTSGTTDLCPGLVVGWFHCGAC